jgi:hypothetical protein
VNKITTIQVEPCPGCGKTNFHTSYSSTCREKKRMDEIRECWDCAFWECVVSDHNELVIDYHTYSVGPEPRPDERKSFLGMSGRRFDIEFLDGRGRFTTHNLWSGGEIPAKFRDRIPNTARFVGAEKAKVGDTTCWNPTPENQGRYPSLKDLKKTWRSE